jgi:hypothetical protein
MACNQLAIAREQPTIRHPLSVLCWSHATYRTLCWSHARYRTLCSSNVIFISCHPLLLCFGPSWAYPNIRLSLGLTTTPRYLHLQIMLGLERPWLPSFALSMPLSNTALGSLLLSLVAPLSQSAEQVPACPLKPPCIHRLREML